ncbi:LuxR C-terminal-related transcriptional regulator [Aeromicrobium sp. HA]|uniref:LuxR C-terminal-related transcriptional regulator n=1 Tax=Aeromicrobium sp. HA TaxID=3009077 RepID=UPI0022AFCE37|nr:LuxR C-terminal-related transcriptional regulator [Aeromicrobium sp. HA]
MVRRSQDEPSSADHESYRAAPATGGWPGIPDRPRQFVSRARLLDLIDADPGCSLVLVSAPAGTGKTSLVVDWATTRAPERLEWITFDAGDVLWPAFVEALGRLGIVVPAGPLPPGDAPLDSRVRRELAVAIASEPEAITIVMDGFDVSSAVVADDLDFLLRHTGHRLRLVLLTRADPVLPLYRYRLEESMTEVRMADLALTDEEAAAVLDLMGVPLRADSVHLLNTRTRGWVTGTRFAGKFLGDHEDPDADVGDVMGESGSIAEYLMGEVLAAHSPEVLDLLMTMSVPDTVEPGLAVALGGHSAVRGLSSLARVNVFIERVPGHAEHYRFHPFFRDLLRAELGYRAPGTLLDLQRRTADWYAREGMLTPAARHYAAIEAWTDLAGLVTDHDAWRQLLLADGTHPLVQELRAIPTALEDPDVVLVRAALALAERDPAAFDREVARLSGATDPGEDVRRALALLLAVRGRDAADPRESAALADAAGLALVSTGGRAESDPGMVPLVCAMQGLGHLREGDVPGAREALRLGADAADRAGELALLVECLGLLALIACCEGDTTRAATLAARAARTASDAGLTVCVLPRAPRIAQAWVALEQFDLRAASEHVDVAARADFVLGDPVSNAMLALVTARLRAAQGDRATAIATIGAALERLGTQDAWLVARLRLELVPWLLARGETTEANEELAQVDDELAGPAVSLAAGQVRLAQGDDVAAATAYARARDQHAPVPVRVAGSLAECARLLRAGAPVQAHRAVVEALQLARPSTLRRPFHEASVPVRQLIQQDRQLATAHAWLFERTGPAAARPRPGSGVESRQPAPVEQLTEKEMEVLGHLAALLTTDEIAAEMYISVNTVRTHVRNILRKLGVTRRNAAVRVAREYELLPG